jgi:homoserine O-acetyltransferase
MNTELFKYAQTFELESGEELQQLEIGFHTYGRLNKEKDKFKVWSRKS